MPPVFDPQGNEINPYAIPGSPTVDSRIINVSGSSLNLRAFISEIRRNGIQHANRYSVQFQLPQGIADAERILKLRAFSASLPGKSMMTKDDIFRYGYGPVDTVPYNSQHGPIPISFILDDKGIVLSTIHKWYDAIVDSDSSQGMKGKYEVAYKDDYAVDLQIQQYDTTGDKTLVCDLYRAFPLVIGDVAVGWDQGNALSILPVTFAYRDYKITKLG